ncbi:hypothetical protein [Streptomyces sp. NPDC057579]
MTLPQAPGGEPGLTPRVARDTEQTTPRTESYVQLPNFLIVAAERG